jgi:hypothetical protein
VDPFEGTQSDWGYPGEATGDPFAEAIPAENRVRMREYQSLLDPNIVPDEE